MNHIGILPDRSYNNTIVHRTSDAEHFQRSKSLSHSYQREKRLHAIQHAISKVQVKQNKSDAKLDSITNNNTKACSSLSKLLPRPFEKILYSNTTMNRLLTLSVPLITAFIHVRTFDSAYFPRGSKFRYPNKGTITEALNGKCNLIRMAYDCRTKIILLQP